MRVLTCQGIFSPSSEDEGEEPYDDDEDEYSDRVAEKILKKRTKGKVVEYLVQWKGLPESKATWENSAKLGMKPSCHCCCCFAHRYLLRETLRCLEFNHKVRGCLEAEEPRWETASRQINGAEKEEKAAKGGPLQRPEEEKGKRDSENPRGTNQVSQQTRHDTLPHPASVSHRAESHGVCARVF